MKVDRQHVMALAWYAISGSAHLAHRLPLLQAQWQQHQCEEAAAVHGQHQLTLPLSCLIGAICKPSSADMHLNFKLIIWALHPAASQASVMFCFFHCVASSMLPQDSSLHVTACRVGPLEGAAYTALS